MTQDAMSVHPCERVLVVDDDPDVLDAVADLLEQGGATVMTATSAREVERILSSGFRPSVIVLDLRLPDGDGEQLAKRLKNDATFKDMPIVAMSADLQLLRRVDGDIDGRVEKPFEWPAFVKTLTELCA